jgi:hypothetical protein
VTPVGQTRLRETVDPSSYTDEQGPPVLVLAPALVVTFLGLDIALGHDLGLLFGLGFVTVCVGLGLLAEVDDFFLAAVLPPLMMLGCMLVVGIAMPSALGFPSAGAVEGVIAGFAHHSWALGLGYVTTLVMLGVRGYLMRLQRI